MDLHFYPIDIDYKVKDDKVLVYLYGRLQNGQKICVIHAHQPFFYASIENIDIAALAEKLKILKIEAPDGSAYAVSWEEVEKELIGKKKRFWKIYTNYPKAVPLISKDLQEAGIECYEKDILFIHRYLRDTGITPMTLVKAIGSYGKEESLRIPAFFAEKIEQESKEVIPKTKILAIDIETYAEKKEINPTKNPILMVGFYGIDEQGNEFRKVITWRRFEHQLDYLEIVQDEVDLLRRCRDIIIKYDPDIITGYFSDGFDFPYIKTRADKYNILFDIGMDASEMIVGTRALARDGECKIKGILHIDIFKFVRNIFGKDLKTDSLSLNAVSEELLGHKKHVVNLDELGHTWDQEPEKLIDFCAYNLHDAHLTGKLCQLLLPDMIEFTKLIGLPVFDIIRMRFSRLVESYIMKRSMEFNVIAPNKPGDHETGQRKEESVEGAFVLEPTPGLYKDMVVFDFRSLYPTIITAHNIGPEGLRCGCCQDKEHVPEKEEYWFCQKEKKFLPTVLEELVLRRADLKRLIKEEKAKGINTKMLEARSYALKILANSFYGYLGFYGARWYSIECAASTTAYARNYIKHTILKAEEKGFKVVYADTDSCFVILEDKIIDQALEFMNEINFDLPGHMELDFQGYYPRGIFVALKGSERGAKKKYALMDEKKKIKITGFEMVRRNWSTIAKEVQEKVLSLILTDKPEEALRYVREIAKELKEGKVPNAKLIIKTQITRELQSYASIGPHVAIAQKLQEKGEAVVPGTVVEYIIAKGTGMVRERARLPDEVKAGEYDAEYYLNHQILPAVSSIFLVLGYKEDELVGESKQTGLGKFF
ncbi:MAG: DNA-directed DNA polymerase [Nanoarchaeota archaeon]|nr:DNA-directed DNA polymerase [Nanoarchaeota archaeon]